jgi:formylmethanofuran dehydrogenase subunit E
MSEEETEALSKTYFSSFKAYTDTEIEQAAKDYMNNGEYFPPKPSQILSLVKNADIGKHTRELVERYTCSTCHEKVSAICDGVCLDCLGVPKPAYQNIKPLPKPTPSDYRMEGRIQCQKCGHVGMGIKEPAESGQWECRQCYTRMNNQEVAAAFRRLVEMVG